MVERRKGPGAGGKEQKNNEFAAKNALRYGFFTALVPLTSSTERENRHELLAAVLQNNAIRQLISHCVKKRAVGQNEAVLNKKIRAKNRRQSWITPKTPFRKAVLPHKQV